MSVLKFFEKNIFFWKNEKIFSPLNDNLFLFFEKIFFPFFSTFFFMDTFFVFRTPFFGEFFLEKTSFHLRANTNYFFFKKIPPKKVSEKQKKCPYWKKKFEKNGKNYRLREKKVFVFFKKKGSLNCPFLKTDTFGFANI